MRTQLTQLTPSPTALNSTYLWLIDKKKQSHLYAIANT